MKNVFHYYFHEAFVKNLMKKLSIFLKSVIKTLWYFNKNFLKFSLTSTLLQNVTIIHFLLLKWRFFQCNAKFKKKSILIAKFTKPLPNALWKWCYFLINFLKSQNKFSRKVNYTSTISDNFLTWNLETLKCFMMWNILTLSWQCFPI